MMVLGLKVLQARTQTRALSSDGPGLEGPTGTRRQGHCQVMVLGLKVLQARADKGIQVWSWA